MQSGIGIRLFQFQQNAAGGSWELCSSNPDLNFYDINEDSAAKKKEWHLELGSDIDILVSDQFSVDATSKRVTLAANTAVYALKFPTAAALQMFESEYNSRLFENTYGMKYDDKNRDQVMAVQMRMQQMHPVPAGRHAHSLHAICVPGVWKRQCTDIGRRDSRVSTAMGRRYGC